jgi:next-to-BRCA1 protein 1
MKTKILTSTLLLVLLLTACAPSATPASPTLTPVDIGAVQTAAVQTVVAAVTQTVAAFTDTPQPTETPVPPSATATPEVTPTTTGTPTETVCDNLLFIVDASVPDNTQMTPGQEFVKTWHVKNTGACTWDAGYNIVFAYGEKMGGQTTALTVQVAPNTEADISIPLKAPVKPGPYTGAWRLSGRNGYPFGTMLTIVIVVK